MTVTRRTFVQMPAGVAALAAASRIARAQAYPLRPVRIVVGFAPGGPNDVLARLVGQWLSERLGQPFVVDNRPGNAGNIATEFVVKAAPDGYTLLQVATSSAVNATLYPALSFEFLRDIAPVASITRQPDVVVINPSVPARTIPEFIAYAKANPGKINMASAGAGTGTHLFGELFKIMTGTKMVHVPYRGAAPALNDVIGGQVQIMFVAPGGIEGHIQAGRLRALAVTSGERLDTLPDVPAVGEFVPGYEASSFFGIAAPARTPADVIARLNKEINAGLADPTLKARLAELGGSALAGSAADFGKLLVAETEKWGKVVKSIGLKPQ